MKNSAVVMFDSNESDKRREFKLKIEFKEINEDE